MKAATINTRMRSLAKTFGKDSIIYKTAQDYIESKVKNDFIKRNKDGDVVGIRQVKTLPDQIFGRSDVFNEYVPAVQDIFSREIKAFKEEMAAGRQGPMTKEEEMLMKTGPRKAMQDPLLSKYVSRKATLIAEDLADWDGTVDDVYQVRDNTERAIDLEDLIAEANDLLDTRVKTADWVRAARDLVTRYTERVEYQRRKGLIA